MSNLARIEPTSIDPYSPRSFEGAWELAQIVAKSRLGNMPTPEAAFMVLALGNDMGLSVSQSLRGIQIIEGKPCPTADCLVACILRSGLAEYFVEVETTAEQSTWETKRKSESKPRRSTFTIEQARTAGLVKPNGNWVKYPERMLKARAKAFLARDVYPDLTLGLYTPEEIREPIHVDVEQVESVDEPIPYRVSTPPWAAIIESARTLDELKTVCNDLVKKDGIPQDEVAPYFKARMAELVAQ